MIFEPGGRQIYVQAIARNEGIHIVYAQMGLLLSQSRKRDARGRLHCFQNSEQSGVGNDAVKKVVFQEDEVTNVPWMQFC